MLWNHTKTASFYLLVAIIVFVSVFPFYYAILTSFKSGTALFEINYLPTHFSLDNYIAVLTTGVFVRNLGTRSWWPRRWWCWHCSWR